MRRLLCLLALFLVPLFLCAQGMKKADLKQAVDAVGAVVDDWHLAAAEGDEARYFGHLSADAVFVGLDETQRWSKNAFREWTSAAFKQKQMWTFRSSERHVSLSPAGDVAWFEELLDTPGMGVARGTGVLVKQGDAWQIAQYALSLPIPPRAFPEVLEVIRVQKLLPKDEAKTPKPQPQPTDGK